MEIERLKMEYVDQVWALHKALTPYMTATAEEARKRYADMLEKEDYFLAVAREDETILGTATGIVCRAMSMPFLVIEDVIVRAECRGTGIGGRLMAELDRFAVENHCEYAILVSSGFRKDAHRFYEKQGYTEDVRGFRKAYMEHM